MEKKKMRKKLPRVRVTFNLDEGVYKRLRELSRDRKQPMSRIVDEAVRSIPGQLRLFV